MIPRRSVLAFLPLLVVACSSTSSLTPGGSSAAAASIDHPLDVQVKLDSAHSASQSITPDGGTLQATAQDGTRYTLTIPKGALLEDLTIGMTPVSGIDGLPLSGKSLAAVQLAPEGLNLLEPATLVIVPETPIPAKELVSFAYQADGKRLHLFPLSGNPAQTTFQIQHFSGYGAGQGDSGGIQQYPPGSAESSADSQAADIFKDSWLNHGGEPNDEAESKLCDVLIDWYKASVVGDLKAVETDTSKLYAAGGQFMRWQKEANRWCESNATVQGEVEAGRKSLAKGLQHAYREATPKCELKLMYQWSKWTQLLSLLTYAPDLTWDPNVKADIKKCQVFQLEVGGSVTFKGTSMTFTIQKGTIPLIRTGETTFEGSLELPGTYEGPKDCDYSGANVKWNLKVRAENSDELVHQGSIFDTDVTMTLSYAGKAKCGDITRAVSGSYPIPVSTFQLPAQDGAHHDWTSPGFQEGAIVFTIKDPNGYLEQIGKANWSGQ